LRENLGRDRVRQLPVQRPQKETDGIPAEVAQAAGGFERGIRADVVSKKILTEVEAEQREQPLQLAEACAIVQNLADFWQARAVHEHHAVKELHGMFPARGEHFFQFGEAGGAGFFAEDMLAGGGGAQDKFFPQTGRQRNVNRVHVRRGEQFFVVAEGAWRFGKGELALAIVNEFAAFLRVTAGDGGDDGVAGVEDRLPVFPAEMPLKQD
jgi:hypothetical protein